MNATEVFWLVDNKERMVTPHLYTTPEEVIEWANKNMAHNWHEAGYKIRVA